MRQTILITSIFFWLCAGQAQEGKNPEGSKPPATVPSLQDYPISDLFTDIEQPFAFNVFNFKEGYVAGRVVDEQNPSFWGKIKLHFFEAQVFVGGNGLPSGVLDKDCKEKKRAEILQNQQNRDFREIDPQLATPEAIERAADLACTELITPMSISAYNRSWYDYFATQTAEDFMIHFREYFVRLPRLQSSYVLINATPIDTSYPLPFQSLDISTEMGLDTLFISQERIIDGRIVLAMLEGQVRNSWQIYIQVEGQGRVYERAGVTDKRLFDFLLRCLASGRMVRLHIYPLWDLAALPSNLLFGYGTRLRIYRADVLQ